MTTNVSNQNSNEVRVPVRPARGPGGQAKAAKLYEAEIDSKMWVIWPMKDGEIAAAPAVCPHRPDRGEILHTHGVATGDGVRCTFHANHYCGATGSCLEQVGRGEPGTLNVRPVRRDGNEFVVEVDGGSK